MAVKTYVVTVPAGIGGGFYLDGVQKPTLAFAKGATYRFDVSDATNATHPLRFSTTSDGTHGGGSEYTTGVTVSGTQGNPGAYVEIDTTTASPDTLYYYCSFHSGMGGQVDLTADSYGANSWNVNSWGNQDDNFINLSGINLSISQGQAGGTLSSGWNSLFYGDGNWGDLPNATANLTGISATFNIGQVKQTSSTGWGRDTWGSGSWNIYGTTTITGNQATANLGSVTVDTEINNGWGRQEWNTLAWGIAGQTQPTGIQLSTNIGSISIDAEVNVGWGSDEWGVEAWGASLQVVIPTGIQLTGNVNSVSISADGEHEVPTGIAMSATLASVGTDISLQVIPTGIGFDINAGSVAEDISLQVIPTGIEMTMQEGDEQAYNRQGWGRYYWGLEEWGASGEWEFVPVTGISMSMTLGSVVATPNTIASPTGIQLTMQEGDEGTTANARVNVTGNALTMGIGTVYNLIWNEVNTGTTSTWTEVDTAA